MSVNYIKTYLEENLSAAHFYRAVMNSECNTDPAQKIKSALLTPAS